VDRTLTVLALVLVVACGVYLLWGLGPRWDFVLRLRATRLAGILLVGTAIAVATVLFQTVTRNRILTPQIMGFDALYVLMQTALVAALGVTGFAGLATGGKFAIEVAVMVGAALALFGTLLARSSQDIVRLVLTGVILGVLFRSAAGFLSRVMDPNAYAIVQYASFATFARVDAALLPFAAALGLGGTAIALHLSPRLDVLALGRPMAVGLGLRHDAMVLAVLAMVAVLVSVSTALVGPLAFFGLIVAGLAHAAAPGAGHARLMPAAILIAGRVLVIGQLVFERVLGLQSALSVVVEFAGGLVFLWLLLTGRVR
jgi:iron complex transport system permease protein